MKKLKWKFIGKEDETDFDAYVSGGLTIEIYPETKRRYSYILYDGNSQIYAFKKLSSAKKVAQLIKNG